jgi:hypothetical protein
MRAAYAQTLGRATLHIESLGPSGRLIKRLIDEVDEGALFRIKRITLSGYNLLGLAGGFHDENECGFLIERRTND